MGGDFLEITERDLESPGFRSMGPILPPIGSPMDSWFYSLVLQSLAISTYKLCIIIKLSNTSAPTMLREDPMLLAADSLKLVVQTFVVAFAAFVFLFAVLEPDVLHCALRSRKRIRNPNEDPAPVSSQDGRSRVQQRALGTCKWNEQTTWRQQLRFILLLLRQQVNSCANDDAGQVQIRAPAKRVSTRNYAESILVESADMRSPRPSAKLRQWRAVGRTLDCAFDVLRRDMSTAGFSVSFQEAIPMNIGSGQGRVTSAQDCDFCLSEAPTRPSSILKTSCEAIKLGLDVREVDTALCHNLCAAGSHVSVSLKEARPLVTGKQQGRTATLTSCQGSACYLSGAPTRPASSPVPHKATKLSLDSREENTWPGMTTHQEEYYVRDLHLGNFRMLRIANKFIRFHAMQAQHDQLSACPKLSGDVPGRLDRFRIMQRGQNRQMPRCFVQESQVVPAAAVGRGFYKTLAKNIKARHATHTSDATPPANPYANQTRLPRGRSNVLAAPRVLGSHQLGNVTDAPCTSSIDMMRFLQSSVDVRSDSGYYDAVEPMPWVTVAAVPCHAHNPGLGCVLNQSVGQAIPSKVAALATVANTVAQAQAAASVAVSSQVVALATVANAVEQAQTAASDSQDEYLVRQRLRMSAGRHRRGSVKALVSAFKFSVQLA